MIGICISWWWVIISVNEQRHIHWKIILHKPLQMFWSNSLLHHLGWWGVCVVTKDLNLSQTSLLNDVSCTALIVPYNPKSDCLTEWTNKTVVQMLTTLVSEVRNEWDDHLPFAMMAYRASVHDTNQFTHNPLMLNHETNLPIDLLFGSPSETPTCLVHYVDWVRNVREHELEFVQQNLKVRAERQKRVYDRKSGFPKFKPGNFVWGFSPLKLKFKFGKPWVGPNLLTTKVNELCYRIQKTPTSCSIVVHVDHVVWNCMKGANQSKAG